MTWLYVPNQFLASPFAQEQAGSTSACTSRSPAIALWVTSSGKPTQRPLSWPGWKMRPWIARLSGTISRPSTADAGVDAWISSLRATRVSRSRLQESGLALPTNAISGRTSGASLSRSGRSGSSLRTSAGTSRSASTLSIESYRSLVLRLRQDFNRRQRLAQVMSANDSSCWPTPRSSPNENRTTRNAPSHGKGHGKTLAGEAAMWPTPSAALTNDGEEPQTFLARQERLKEQGINGNGAGIPLTIASKISMQSAWPTASARDWKSGAASDETMDRNARPLNEIAVSWGTPSTMDAKGRTYTRDSGEKGRERPALTAQAQAIRSPSTPPGPEMQTDGPSSSAAGQTLLRLSPNFVEWLMGWPIGWTDCGSPVTGWSRWLQQQRTALSNLSWNFEPLPDSEPEPLQLELV